MNIDKLKQVIVKANPELVRRSVRATKIDNEWKATEFKGQFLRPYSLADVLMAIDKADEMIMIDWEGQFRQFGCSCSSVRLKTGEDMPKWNLKDDDLEHQSDETLTFLTELLVIPKGK